MLTTAIAVGGGAVLGILLVNRTHDPGENQAGESPCTKRKRERLLYVKNKMERHRERLDRQLSRINARIEAVSKV